MALNPKRSVLERVGKVGVTTIGPIKTVSKSPATTPDLKYSYAAQSDLKDAILAFTAFLCKR
jgi:hypothetical protein